MAPIARRQFLQQGGLLAAAIGLASAGSNSLLEVALGAPSTPLAESRRRTYIALVEAVAAIEGAPVPPDTDPVKAADAFDGYYSALLPQARSHVDDVLDTLEAGPSGSSFSRSDLRARKAFLHSWAWGAGYPPPDGGPPTRASAGSPESAELVRRNAKSFAGERDPRTHVRTVRLNPEAQPEPFEPPSEERRRAHVVTTAATAAALPFSPAFRFGPDNLAKPPSVTL